jgi:hypothetical protein
MNKELLEGYLDVVKKNIAGYKSEERPVPGERYLQRDMLEAILELNDRLRKIEDYWKVR